MVNSVPGAGCRVQGAVRRAGCGALGACLLASVAGAQPASESRLHWVTNGTVTAAAVHDQTLYIGGSFTRVAPAANFLGPWFGVSTTTGAALPRLPVADGAVFAIEPDGAGGHYVGGRFTSIGGIARPGLAHILGDGRIDLAFTPSLEPALESTFDLVPVLEVRALARAGGRLLVGGSFRITTGGVTRVDLAALDAASGTLETGVFSGVAIRAEKFLRDGPRVLVMGRTAAPPNVTAAVIAIDAASGHPAWTQSLGQSGTVFDGVLAGGRLVVVGSFMLSRTNNWQTSIVSLDPLSGAVDPAWTPIPRYYPVDPPSIHAVTAVGGTLYLGGRFSDLDALPRAGLGAVDLATGTITAWAPEVNGIVWDLAPASASSLYVAGDFRRAGGAVREGLAEIDVAGVPSAWTAAAYSTDVRTMHRDGTQLLAGGGSAVTGGVPRDYLAAFTLDLDDVLPWAPSVGFPVVDLATNGTRVFAGLRQINLFGTVVPRVAVVAFEAAGGAPAAWEAPDHASVLLGLADGHVYVRGFFGAVQRLNAGDGRVDTRFELSAPPSLVGMLATGSRTFLYHHLPDAVVDFDLRTGARSPWRPRGLSTQGNTFVTAAALMGQTMYVSQRDVQTGLQQPAAVDADSGAAVSFAPALPAWVEDLAAADGLVVVASRSSPGASAVSAHLPDGTPRLWNVGLTPTDFDARRRRGELRAAAMGVVVTDADVIVTGVQRLGEAPVHGVAVLPRQHAEAPASLDAEVVDDAVRLSWEAPAQPQSSYVIEVGSQPGASNVLVASTGSDATVLDASAPPRTYFVRIRSAGAAPGPASAASNEIAVRTGCVEPRTPPTGLAAVVSGVHVTLSWTAPAFIPVARYVVEAGSESGAANLARIAVPGTHTSFASDAPRGRYFVRVRAENACGVSQPSTQVWFSVGEGELPLPPANLAITGSAGQYAARWDAVPGATAYVVEVGTEPGLANVGTVVAAGPSLGPASVAIGQRFYVRVRAVNAVGLGPPGNEQLLIAR